MPRSNTLEGMTAVVTGASGAIGGSCAHELVRDGATLLIMARNEEKLAAAREAMLARNPGARIECFPGDAADEDQVKAAMERAHSLTGRLDIVVATIGHGGFMPLLLETTEGFIREYQTSVLSAFYAMKHAVPLMRKGGSIVCISSAAAVRPSHGLGAYCAAKAALDMFVQVAADELGSAGIRINSVRPGLVRSAGAKVDPEIFESFRPVIPLGRVGEGEDIAPAVRFLAGPESNWVTGQCLNADGGQGLRGFPNPSSRLDTMFGAEVMAKVRAGKPPR